MGAGMNGLFPARTLRFARKALFSFIILCLKFNGLICAPEPGENALTLIQGKRIAAHAGHCVLSA
jgi:hypothetical protein